MKDRESCISMKSNIIWDRATEPFLLFIPIGQKKKFPFDSVCHCSRWIRHNQIWRANISSQPNIKEDALLIATTINLLASDKEEIYT